MRNNKNFKLILPILGVFILIVLVVGISYAAFSYAGKGEIENSIRTGTISMVYNEGENGIYLDNAIPMEDSLGKVLSDSRQKFDFTVNINIIGKTTINYEVTAEKQEGSTLQDDEVRIYLEKSIDNTQYNAVSDVSNYKGIEQADKMGAQAGEMILDAGSSSKTTTYYYRLRMWVGDNFVASGDAKTFTVKVNVYGSDGGKIEAREYLNPPKLNGDMIPVTWNGTNWIKADTRSKWYDYDNQMWANAVTIKDAGKRTEYKNAEVGKVINLEDVNLMLVWIPRYSYTLKEKFGYQISGAGELSVTTPGAFDIKFISANQIETGSGKYSGEEPENYYTPSSFCWGNTCDDEEKRSDEGNIELTGIWVSKFELTGDINNITSIPNKTSIRSQTNQAFFDAIKKQFTTEGVTNCGFTGSNYDTHMMKNTEWGAMAYLSQSKYGKYGNSNYAGANKEIYINDYTGFQTGCSKGVPGTGASASTNKSDTCKYTYEKLPEGTGASTTGTIYGIYDTVGGSWERVMGNLNDSVSSSGFSTMPEAKYYNKYTGTTGIKGDATNTEGTNGFYGDYQTFVSSSYPWFLRGGDYIHGVVAGVFGFYNGYGGSHASVGSRLVFAAW